MSLDDRLKSKRFKITKRSPSGLRLPKTPKELAREFGVSESYLRRRMSAVLDLGWTGREWF